MPLPSGFSSLCFLLPLYWFLTQVLLCSSLSRGSLFFWACLVSCRVFSVPLPSGSLFLFLSCPLRGSLFLPFGLPCVFYVAFPAASPSLSLLGSLPCVLSVPVPSLAPVSLSLPCCFPSLVLFPVAGSTVLVPVFSLFFCPSWFPCLVLFPVFVLSSFLNDQMESLPSTE